MVVSCCALNCSERFVKGGEVKFHMFPEEPDLKGKWIRAVRRADWMPSAYSRICSRHFHPSCFKELNDRKYLNEKAVPTIFDYRDRKGKKRGSPKKRRLSLSSEPADGLQEDDDSLTGVLPEDDVDDGSTAMDGTPRLQKHENQQNLVPQGNNSFASEYDNFSFNHFMETGSDSESLEDHFGMKTDAVPEESLTKNHTIEVPRKELHRREGKRLKDCIVPKDPKSDQNGDLPQDDDAIGYMKPAATQPSAVNSFEAVSSGTDVTEKLSSEVGTEQEIAAFLTEESWKGVASADSCMLCKREVQHGVSVLQCTGATQRPLRHRLDKLAAEAGLQPPCGSLLCARCAHVLNYTDRIELELIMLCRTIADCVCSTHHLCLPLPAPVPELQPHLSTGPLP